MLKTYKALFSLVCCLLLVTYFSLPVAAQTSTSGSNQSLSNQSGQTQTDQGVSGQQQNGINSNPNSDQFNSTPSDQDNSDINRNNTDVDRQKPADTGVESQGTQSTTRSDTYQSNQSTTTTTDRDRGQMNSDRDDNSSNDNDPNAGNLPRTASGIPLTGLIGAVSMFGFAIRRWL
jgi:hypothetical protein